MVWTAPEASTCTLIVSPITAYSGGMLDNDALTELARRVDELDAREQIRTLAADYAKWIDAKDLVAVGRLFTPDTVVGEERGRDAKVRALVRNHGAPGRFGTTIHLVCGH